jgi:hypothetical protein
MESNSNLIFVREHTRGWMNAGQPLDLMKKDKLKYQTDSKLSQDF